MNVVQTTFSECNVHPHVENKIMPTMVTVLRPISERDILSQDFFKLTYETIFANDSLGFAFDAAIEPVLGFTFSTVVYLLGKCFYSTILSDLGQSVESNIFAHLPTFVKVASEVWGHQFHNAAELLSSIGIGVPSVTPSTIAAQYLCQVPLLKSTASLIISILVADLVFL